LYILIYLNHTIKNERLESITSILLSTFTPTNIEDRTPLHWMAGDQCCNFETCATINCQERR
jgi:hypothetical protein